MVRNFSRQSRMDPEGAASEASWHSFDPSVAAEDSAAMAELLGVQYFGSEEGKAAMFWPSHEADQNYYYSSPAHYLHQPNSGASSSTSNSSYLLSGGYYEGCYIGDGDFFVPEEEMADPSFMLDLNLQFEDGGGGEAAAGKRKAQECKGEAAEAAPKKKARATAAPASKKGKSAQSKKAQKGAATGGTEEGNGLSSSSYTSEEESQEVTGRSNVSSGSKKSAAAAAAAGGSEVAAEEGVKMRAGRGSATDPQSLYARKRRERINGRLKILQNLVPNGTKVDISTMLEEAVHYVKFMQLQIKLLSSDEHWMYAPIAYNGVNIGIDLKISPPQ